MDIVDEYCDRFSNWGRWGPKDQLGTANYITPEMVRGAAGLVRLGEVVSLSLPFDGNGPQTGDLGRINPGQLSRAKGSD